MRVEVLGEVQVVGDDGRVADLGGGRQRRVLVALVERRPQVVALSSLVDRVWSDEAPPPNAERSVRTYISRLRSGVAVVGGADIIRTAPSGYGLHASAVTVDADELDGLARSAAEALQRGEPAEALRSTEEALRLWRGEPFGDLRDLDWLQPEAARLAELHVLVAEERAEALLDLGELERAVAESVALSAAYPVRERPWRLQMLALHRAGRQAEALAAYQRYRKNLATDVGLEPGEALKALERRIAWGDAALLSASPSPQPLRGYQLEGRLGEGAFSVVYQAAQPSVGRQVAIKQIRAELANRPEFIRRFEAEARMVARLEHPHIVPLYDFWREPGSAYLVMRLLRGGNLEKPLLEGPWSLERTVRMASEIGSALATAHREGVVHRDVKSANVLLDTDGRAYLTDFGIALEAAERADPSASLSAGSPAYASPEQLRREPVGPTADVHGLGIAIYEALVGRLPFPDEPSHAALLQRQLNDPVPPVRRARPDLPVAVDAVIARATAKDAAARYPTVEELVADLVAASSGGGTGRSPRFDRGASTAVGLGERNPYKGLRAFDEADVADFAGRERLVDALVEAVAARHLVAVVGPSGSGKSSVVRAGLLPALRRGAAPGSSDWFVSTFVPGRHPYEELEAALLRVSVSSPATLLEQLTDGDRGLARALLRILPERGELLLVIDQFEELFTLATPDVASRFLASVVAAVTEERSRLRVVLTLRADFYDRPLRHGGLGRLVRDGTVLVLPLQADEVERAIVEPAERVGCELEPGLVSEIVADVTDQPGALPLLQYALTELWERRVSGLLTRDAYRQLGGVAGALARRAEELYVGSSPDEQAAARRVMGRLVAIDEGGGHTRRRATRSELGAGDGVDAAVERFGAGRLLSFDRDATTREPTVEVAHEALLHEWPRLARWLEEDRHQLALLRHLSDAAHAWEGDGRDAGDLYRGGRLEGARELRESSTVDLTALERDFIDASAAAADAEAAARRSRMEAQVRSNRRLRRVLAATGVALVCAVVAGLLAFQQRQRADEQAVAATAARSGSETRRLGWEAAFRVENDRQVGLLLAAEAHRRDPGPESLGALQRVLVGTEGYLGVLGAGQSWEQVAWTDRSTVIGFTSSGVVEFDPATATELARVDVGVKIRTESDTNDGQLIRTALAGTDRAGALVVVAAEDAPAVEAWTWDAGAPAWRSPIGAEVDAVAVSPAGDRVAVLDLDGTLTLLDGDDGTLVARHVAHPEATHGEQPPPPGVVPFPGTESLVVALRRGHASFSADGATLVVGRGRRFSTWDASSGEPVSGPQTAWSTYGGETPTAVPIWGLTADAGRPGSLLHWTASYVYRFDVDGQQNLATVRAGGANSFFGAPKVVDVVGVHGDEVAVVLNQGQLTWLDLATGAESRPSVDLQLGLVTAAAADAAGDVIAVATAGGIALWSLDGRRLLARTFPRDGANAAALTPDGAQLLRLNSSSIPGSPQPAPILDVATGEPRAFDVSLPAGERVSGWHVWADGGALTLGVLRDDEDGGLYRIDPVSLQAGAFLRLGATWFSSSASWDGAYFASSREGRIELYDFRTGELLAQRPGPGGEVKSFSFAADGQALAAATATGAGQLYRLPSLEPLVSPLDDDEVFGVKFSPDGRWLVTLDQAGSMVVRHGDGLAPVRTLVGAALAQVGQAEIRFLRGDLLVANVDGSTRLWDLASGTTVGGPFPNDPGGIAMPSDGADVVLTMSGHAVLLWDVDTGRWDDVACTAAGRNLTAEEWRQFGPAGEPYQQTCPQWPIAVA